MAWRWCASPALGGLCLLSLLALTGCQDDSPEAPPAPPGRGPGTSVGRPDAGLTPPPPSGDDDGGSDGSFALAGECIEVEPTPVVEDTPLGEFNNAISLPTDLEVSRVVATWQPGCAQPTLHIEMSDGECPDGRGHALTFLLGATEIDGGTLAMGQNLLVEEPGVQGLRVRYARPSRLRPSGEWGTCTGVSGTLDLLGPLRLERGERLQGRFQMDLPPCDGSDQEVQTLSGTFQVELERGVQDVCPDF